MKGVRKNGIGWQVSFGKNIQEYYPNEEDAVNRRLELESKYGDTIIGGRKDHYGEKIGNFNIIGDTGNSSHGSQIVLVRNTITNKLSTKNIKTLRRFNQGMNGLGKKMNNNTGITGVFKRGNKYVSHIGIEGKVFLLGTFSKKEDASHIYQKAKINWLKYGIKPADKVKRDKKDKGLPAGITKTRNSTYAVSLIVNKKHVLRKTFKTLPEAEQALEQAKQKLKETN